MDWRRECLVYQIRQVSFAIVERNENKLYSMIYRIWGSVKTVTVRKTGLVTFISNRKKLKICS